MCLRSVEGVGDAAELGEGILDEDLLDDPPEGRTIGDVIIHASRHSRVQDGEPVARAREDKRARVTMVRKVARILAIVIDDHVSGLESKVGGGISLHAGIAAQCELSRAAVLGDDVKGVTVLVLRVGTVDETARQSASDGELEVGWDVPVIANGSDGPEEILEFTGAVLVS